MTAGSNCPENQSEPGNETGDSLPRLRQAIDLLGGDTDWFIEALTERIAAMRPIAVGALSAEQKQLLVALGEFTEDELEETIQRVERGALQLATIETFVADLHSTLSLRGAAAFLRKPEPEVARDAEDGRLCVVAVAGKLRFPAWQFHAAFPDKLVPGLAEIIGAMPADWSWQHLTAFMHVRHDSLVARARQTPVDWLRDGGDVAAVTVLMGWKW